MLEKKAHGKKKLTFTPAQARTYRGYSTQKMADILGLTRKTYSNKEHGRSSFTYDEAQRFIRAVKLPPDMIVFSRNACAKK